MSDEKRFLSITQAARRLGISPSTLRNYADRGDVPVTVLPGSRYRRFDPADLDHISQVWKAKYAASLTDAELGEGED